MNLPFVPKDPRIVDSTGALELRFIPKRMLVIGGGIMNGMGWALADIERSVKERAFPAIAKDIRVVSAEHANWAGALGAALL